MFSRKDVPEAVNEAKVAARLEIRTAAPGAIRSAAPSPSMKRPNQTSAPSIIGNDIVVNGTLTSEGEVQIDGHVKGDVRCAVLVVGEHAFVEGDIAAGDVTVRGRVKGNITAHKVHLSSTCRVEGDIHRQSMSVESGAHFEGNSRHSEDPLSGANASRLAAADFRSDDSVVKLAR